MPGTFGNETVVTEATILRNPVVIIGHVGVIHVGPEADLAGELLPHALVFPDGFLAFLNEGLDAVGLDPVLAFDADLLLHFQLDRKAVGVSSPSSYDSGGSGP